MQPSDISVALQSTEGVDNGYSDIATKGPQVLASAPIDLRDLTKQFSAIRTQDDEAIAIMHNANAIWKRLPRDRRICGNVEKALRYFGLLLERKPAGCA